ncbi:MAG: hypothetical protein WCN98_13475 [Verrucomicrobiaceae bacterium]
MNPRFRDTRFKTGPALCLLGWLLVGVGMVPGAGKQDKAASAKEEANPVPVRVPEDLVGNEHVREEFGVNEFTTPSIRKIFDQLDALGTLSYDNLKRPVAEKPPGDRVLLSLALGTLIADGFLVVHCEKIEEMEKIGRNLLKYAKALGAGMRINKHSQSLLENSVKGDWKKLRNELASTQSDVEAEMVLLRDSDVAHLISLGGWLRAFEISTDAVAQNYTPEKSRQLSRTDIVEYYIASLEDLHPEIKKVPAIQDLIEGLQAMRPLLDVPAGKAFTEEEVKDLRDKARVLGQIVRQSIPGK